MPYKVKPVKSVKQLHDRLEIYCETFTTPLWKHNDNKFLQRNVYRISKKIIVIKNIAFMNKGNYTCEGITVHGTYFYSESILRVASK